MATSVSYSAMTGDSQEPNRGKPVFLKSKDIPGFNGKNVYADELFKCLLHVVPSSEIKGIQRIGGLWRLYITNKDARIKLITNGLNIRSVNVCVYDSNPFLPGGREDTLRLVVKDIPLSVHENVITDELERRKCKITGKMHYQKLRVDGKLTKCLTGDRVLYVEPMASPLPRTITFGLFKGRIFHVGQPDPNKANKICSRCLKSGHLRSACMNEIVCRICKQTGHVEADCPTHDTPTSPANQQSGKRQPSRWSRTEDQRGRHENRQADTALSRDRYEIDFPPAEKLSHRRSNSLPRRTRSSSRTASSTSSYRHHAGPRRDHEDSSNMRSSDAANPQQLESTAAFRPAEQKSETADQTAPPKPSNQQQSKITQFIEQARQHSDAIREHNGKPADTSALSDQHSADNSACSEEDESESGEYSECEEDNITQHQSDLSTESPETGKVRGKVNQTSKRKQKPKKKTAKKR
ncbi:uncharacterized protein [Diadema setosum]|uniref:uncharacterized protein n=1 Tax=Diadema setosum TaxID=31175 RepID=UPI003B3A10B2